MSALAPLRRASAICPAHRVGEGGARHRPKRGRGVERIADDVFAGEIGEAIDEVIEDGGIDIDALDAAAALAGIVEGAVDQILDRVIELGVGADIGRVLAAELEPERSEGAGSGALDGAAAGDRAGEIDVVDPARAEQLLGLLVR